MQVILGLMGAGAALAWVVAFASCIAMIRNRAPGVTLLYLASHGIAFFDASKFTSAAAPHRRRLGLAFAAFFLLVIGLIVVGVVFQGKAGA